MKNCILCKIRDKLIAKELTYEDKYVMVFPDIHPIKPIHLLIMPKEHVTDFSALEKNHADLLVHLVLAIQKIVDKYKLGDKGYRLIVNGGGAQLIDHLHIHLTGPWGKVAVL